MRRRLPLPLAAVGLLACALAGRSASALPPHRFGFDLDGDTSGLNTQAGFQRVSFCMFAPGETPRGCPAAFVETSPAGTGAGYRSGARPVGGSTFTLHSATDAPDLWKDGHRVASADAEAVLRLYGIPEGRYELVLLSHDPRGGIHTAFRVDGEGVGEIVGVPRPADLLAEQGLRVPVQVGPAGTLDVGFRPARAGLEGQLNGVLLLPAPEDGAPGPRRVQAGSFGPAR